VHHKILCNLLFLIGIKNDYYVAMGITYQGYFEFPNKKFFYCLSNDFYFKEMPDLNDQHKLYIDRDTSYFTGEPGRKLIQPVDPEGGEGAEGAADGEENEEGEGEDDDKSEEEEIKVPPKDLTELDRLKYVTLAIENDCQIAPIGAYKMTA